MTNGTRREWGVSVTPRPLFTPGKDRVPIVQEAGWDPGPVCTGAENLAPTGIGSVDRPVRSQSLYRLSYRAHKQILRLQTKKTLLEGWFKNYVFSAVENCDRESKTLRPSCMLGWLLAKRGRSVSYLNSRQSCTMSISESVACFTGNFRSGSWRDWLAATSKSFGTFCNLYQPSWVVRRVYSQPTVQFQLIQDTSRQQLGWTLPDTVNTVKCSWRWAKTSPEKCRANLE
jgi:hypothetical protein